MNMREPAKYGNDEAPIPVFYVSEIYQDTFRHEKPTPLNLLYSMLCGFPQAVGSPLQVAAKQHVILRSARHSHTTFRDLE
jgi:hypothetical protein